MVIVFWTAFPPPGHRGKPHPVMNDVEQLSVRQLLGLLFPEVWSFGIDGLADVGLAAPVVSVTQGAVIGEVPARIRQHFGRGLNGVPLVPQLTWNREMP
jgi:hypothetical protein